MNVGMPIKLERRKKVMARSIKLGHCVCNPRQGCPCDIFKQHNVCPCAGERLAIRPGVVPLTHAVRKAGCASKISQADLKRILGRLPPITDPKVVVGTAAGDDAGVYRLDDQYSLVQTVDVFTPCVDDAYLFGEIAAANSLSDIYAMGGRPLTALSIIGFPIEELDRGLMEALLQGGQNKLTEAGCSLIGGHSLEDAEIKCGFAITGLIDSQVPVLRDNARPGDALVLTKPLGTGMISFAAQLGRLAPAGLAEAGRFMATLNRDACELMLRHQAHACTDITGFGLLGHLVEMARNSQVDVELDLAALPVLAAAVECLEQEILPGAIERNEEFAMAWVRHAGSDGSAHWPILYDAQTSGGLLIALPETPALALVRDLQARGHEGAAVIGHVKDRPDRLREIEVTVQGDALANLVGQRGTVQPAHALAISPLPTRDGSSAPYPAATAACCATPPEGAASYESPPTPPRTEAMRRSEDNLPASGAGEATRATADLYRQFLEGVNQAGQLEARQKKLMAIALAVATRCQPCLAAHLNGARAMGLTKPEMDEAAWMGVAFGGSPAMMVYRAVCRELNL